MNQLEAVCRIERGTKRPIIVYRDMSARYGLAGYTIDDQHCELHPRYYLDNTRKAVDPSEVDQCVQLGKHYAAICAKYSHEQLIIRKRLSKMGSVTIKEVTK
jgi:hypothetical protein